MLPPSNAPSDTSTNATPRSTSRRAIKQPWPNTPATILGRGRRPVRLPGQTLARCCCPSTSERGDKRFRARSASEALGWSARKPSCNIRHNCKSLSELLRRYTFAGERIVDSQVGILRHCRPVGVIGNCPLRQPSAARTSDQGTLGRTRLAIKRAIGRNAHEVQREIGRFA